MTAHGAVLKSLAALQDQTRPSRPLSVGFLDCCEPNISTGCQPKNFFNASEPIGCSQVASVCSWSVASVVLHSTRASPVHRLYHSISLPAVGRGPLAVRTVAPLSTCAAAASPMASSTQSRPPIQRSFPAGAGGGQGAAAGSPWRHQPALVAHMARLSCLPAGTTDQRHAKEVPTFIEEVKRKRKKTSPNRTPDALTGDESAVNIKTKSLDTKKALNILFWTALSADTAPNNRVRQHQQVETKGKGSVDMQREIKYWRRKKKRKMSSSLSTHEVLVCSTVSSPSSSPCYWL